ncbi:hypothetical protein IAT38_008414 [Cryptococcus sp. DSM 104549]
MLALLRTSALHAFVLFAVFVFFTVTSAAPLPARAVTDKTAVEPTFGLEPTLLLSGDHANQPQSADTGILISAFSRHGRQDKIARALAGRAIPVASGATLHKEDQVYEQESQDESPAPTMRKDAGAHMRASQKATPAPHMNERAIAREAAARDNAAGQEEQEGAMEMSERRRSAPPDTSTPIASPTTPTAGPAPTTTRIVTSTHPTPTPTSTHVPAPSDAQLASGVISHLHDHERNVRIIVGAVAGVTALLIFSLGILGWTLVRRRRRLSAARVNKAEVETDESGEVEAQKDEPEKDEEAKVFPASSSTKSDAPAEASTSSLLESSIELTTDAKLTVTGQSTGVQSSAVSVTSGNADPTASPEAAPSPDASYTTTPSTPAQPAPAPAGEDGTHNVILADPPSLPPSHSTASNVDVDKASVVDLSLPETFPALSTIDELSPNAEITSSTGATVQATSGHADIGASSDVSAPTIAASSTSTLAEPAPALAEEDVTPFGTLCAPSALLASPSASTTISSAAALGLDLVLSASNPSEAPPTPLRASVALAQVRGFSHVSPLDRLMAKMSQMISDDQQRNGDRVRMTLPLDPPRAALGISSDSFCTRQAAVADTGVGGGGASRELPGKATNVGTIEPLDIARVVPSNKRECESAADPSLPLKMRHFAYRKFTTVVHGDGPGAVPALAATEGVVGFARIELVPQESSEEGGGSAHPWRALSPKRRTRGAEERGARLVSARESIALERDSCSDRVDLARDIDELLRLDDDVEVPTQNTTPPPATPAIEIPPFLVLNTVHPVLVYEVIPCEDDFVVTYQREKRTLLLDPVGQGDLRWFKSRRSSRGTHRPEHRLQAQTISAPATEPSTPVSRPASAPLCPGWVLVQEQQYFQNGGGGGLPVEQRGQEVQVEWVGEVEQDQQAERVELVGQSGQRGQEDADRAWAPLSLKSKRDPAEAVQQHRDNAEQLAGVGKGSAAGETAEDESGDDLMQYLLAICERSGQMEGCSSDGQDGNASKMDSCTESPLKVVSTKMDRATAHPQTPSRAPSAAIYETAPPVDKPAKAAMPTVAEAEAAFGATEFGTDAHVMAMLRLHQANLAAPLPARRRRRPALLAPSTPKNQVVTCFRPWDASVEAARAKGRRVGKVSRAGMFVPDGNVQVSTGRITADPRGAILPFTVFSDRLQKPVPSSSARRRGAGLSEGKVNVPKRCLGGDVEDDEFFVGVGGGCGNLFGGKCKGA